MKKAEKINLIILTADEVAKNYAAAERIAGKERAERANRLKGEDKLLCIGAGCLIALYAGEVDGYGPFGKPYSNAAFFSVSHTSGLVAIAVSKSAEVGLDIEKRVKKPASLIDFCLSDGEKGLDFFDAFCAKESLAKAVGKGITRGVKNIPAVPLDGAVEWEGGEYYRKRADIDGYACSVTARAPFDVVVKTAKIIE